MNRIYYIQSGVNKALLCFTNIDILNQVNTWSLKPSSDIDVAVDIVPHIPFHCIHVRRKNTATLIQEFQSNNI